MRLLLSTIAKVFYNERLREAAKLNREADLRYQMAGIRLADAESRYLELTKLAGEGDFDGDFPKIWEELKQLGQREEEAYRQRLEDLENAYQKRSLLLEDRCRQAIDLEKKKELAETSVEQLNEIIIDARQNGGSSAALPNVSMPMLEETARLFLVLEDYESLGYSTVIAIVNYITLFLQ